MSYASRPAPLGLKRAFRAAAFLFCVAALFWFALATLVGGFLIAVGAAQPGTASSTGIALALSILLGWAVFGRLRR